jgi:putative endonuclease
MHGELREWRVYVLCNPDAKFYIGISSEMKRRLIQHNQGKSAWTKQKGPWRLIWQSEQRSYTEARKLENKLKRQKGGDGFYKITGLTRSSAVNPAAAGS